MAFGRGVSDITLRRRLWARAPKARGVAPRTRRFERFGRFGRPPSRIERPALPETSRPQDHRVDDPEPAGHPRQTSSRLQRLAWVRARTRADESAPLNQPQAPPPESRRSPSVTSDHKRPRPSATGLGRGSPSQTAHGAGTSVRSSCARTRSTRRPFSGAVGPPWARRYGRASAWPFSRLSPLRSRPEMGTIKGSPASGT